MTSNHEQRDDETIKIFVGDQSGPDDLVAFFEDDGETGYLYVSDRGRNEIIQHLQIYINSEALDVKEKDVRVFWSKDGKKCGVVIWGGMRGIIDVQNNREGRVLLTSRATPPIDDSEWLKGFEEYLG